MSKRSLLFIGLFTPGTSYLHRVDPRVKLALSLIIIILALFSYSILFHAGLSLALLGVLLSVGMPSKSLLKFITPLLFAVVITFCLHLLFSGKEGTEIFSIAGVRITREGMLAGVLFSLRVVLFFFSTVVVTATVSPSEMADAVTQSLRPLGTIGLPVQDISLILFMAMRFIPLLYDEFTTVMYAQQVRGVNFSGSFVSKVRNLSSVIIPAFAGITQRADSAAIALKARGYSATAKRSQYMQRAMRSIDWGIFIGMLLFLTAFFYLTKIYAAA